MQAADRQHSALTEVTMVQVETKVRKILCRVGHPFADPGMSPVRTLDRGPLRFENDVRVIKLEHRSSAKWQRIAAPETTLQ
jgi:hypothetical protein